MGIPTLGAINNTSILNKHAKQQAVPHNYLAEYDGKHKMFATRLCDRVARILSEFKSPKKDTG